ncbi:MAG: hypothetical protein IKS98_13110 [Lachnospiraceae bacterium]|nr:hypothetical protein [Lachnospiraceae bacterium]
MEKKFSRFLRYNLVRDKAGNKYRLQNYCKEEVDTVTCVKEENEGEYERLIYARQRRDLAPVESARISELEILLPVEEVEVSDFVRFITPKYDIKFIVKNLGYVSVNGEKRLVVSHGDGAHFSFYCEKENGEFAYRGIYHICEFAEMTEKNNLCVEPLSETFTEAEAKKLGGMC